jgi:hypothetical protein
VWVSLLIAMTTVALAGTGAQANGGPAAASDGQFGISAAGDRATEPATTRRGKRKRRPGCRRFCQQAGGFGADCDEKLEQRDCDPVEMPKQTLDGTRDHIVSIRATCELETDCVGAIILSSFKGEFGPPAQLGEYGRADLKIPPGETRKVKLWIEKPGYEYLKDHGKDRSAFATVPLTDKTQPVSISGDITVLPPD